MSHQISDGLALGSAEQATACAPAKGFLQSRLPHELRQVHRLPLLLMSTPICPKIDGGGGACSLMSTTGTQLRLTRPSSLAANEIRPPVPGWQHSGCVQTVILLAFACVQPWHCPLAQTIHRRCEPEVIHKHVTAGVIHDRRLSSWRGKMHRGRCVRCISGGPPFILSRYAHICHIAPSVNESPAAPLGTRGAVCPASKP